MEKSPIHIEFISPKIPQIVPNISLLATACAPSAKTAMDVAVFPFSAIRSKPRPSPFIGQGFAITTSDMGMVSTYGLWKTFSSRTVASSATKKVKKSGVKVGIQVSYTSATLKPYAV